MSADYFTVGSDGFPHIDKDPNARLNYTWDFTEWLLQAGSSAIDTVTVIPPESSDLVLVGTPVISGGKKVVAVLEGGTVGTSYPVTCRISTTEGYIDDRTIVLDVKET